ncbi:MAG: LysM peptidoglycan-binding domain-containing protein [Anaerolineales bacterium]|nr:LysM peptidoglycan-binding domain-containing protein [Anaerolineales bacterium]
MRKQPIWALALLTLTLSLLPPKGVLARPPAQEDPPTPAEVIEAVNVLRIANGLLPLNTHPVLMQIAQWEANAIAGGAPGHTRPDGLTLGQWLLSLGYPLSGDLSMDGYRSENWIAARTAQEAVNAWLGDGPHSNTMLSPDRSDIGAGVAVSDQIYVVLETALQTSSGKMQYDAYEILTAIASGGYSANADSSVPQYIIPVKRSTARPDGNVIHKVQYGQSLWSIAVTYNTTIDQIRAWNSLGETTEIYDGQILLVQMGATQPPPPTKTPLVTITPFIVVTPTGSSIPPTLTAQPSATSPGQTSPSRASTPGIWAGIIVLVALAAGIIGTWVTTNRSPR